ncbi:MAG: DUF1566 domain-containing protein [Pseudomonadota bacterium]
MNLNTKTLPAAIGAALAGGLFFGLINEGGETFALIMSPKAVGEREGTWNDTDKAVAGAVSYTDGLANTIAMAEAGSALAQWARQLDIEGHTDWYIPSRDELELAYRNLKPSTEENTQYGRSGENPSALPPTHAYTSSMPAQTMAETFVAGGAEAMESEWYWSSTQHAAHPSFAWYQYFSYGDQFNFRKSYEGRARAVRRFKI